MPDPRAGEIEDLQAGPLGQSFGEELPEDFAGPLVGTDQRGDLEDEALRAGIAVEPGALVEDPVGEPVGQHIDREAHVRLFGRGRVGKERAHQRLAQLGERIGHGFTTFRGMAASTG